MILTGIATSLLVLCTAAPAAGQEAANSLSAAERAEGWILLWDGKSTEGWDIAANSQMEISDGAMRQARGAFVWLRTKATYADFVLRLQFRMLTDDGDSGVFIRASKDGDPTRTGYQININNMNQEYGTGSIVNRVKYSGTRFKTGQWYSYEITAQGDHIVAVLDGTGTVDFRDAGPREGHIGLQFVKPQEVEFRNIRIRSLTGAVR